MSDLIYRQDAIDAMEQWLYDSKDNRTMREVVYELLSAEPEIIHCKNCKHRESNDCLMYYEEWIEIDEGDGYFDTDNIIHDWTIDEGFCHCPELRSEEGRYER